MREFPGASYDSWKQTNSADAELSSEPDDEEWCTGCGHSFAADHDNWFRHRWGEVAYCDQCMAWGVPYEMPDAEKE